MPKIQWNTPIGGDVSTANTAERDCRTGLPNGDAPVELLTGRFVECSASVSAVKRAIVCLLPLCLLTACGGDDGDDGRDATPAEWCAVAELVEAGEGDFQTALEGDTESVKAGLESWQSLLDDAAKSAPDEILADVNTTADGVDQLAKSLADADYDVEAVMQSDDLVDLAADMESATINIKAYNAAECGIVTEQSVETTETTNTATITSTTSVVDDTTAAEQTAAEATSVDQVAYTGDTNSDWCIAARQLDSITNDIDATLSDPAAAEAFFTEVLPMFDAALPLAPDEIAAEVALAVDGFHQLGDAFSVAGYDILNADLAVLNDASIREANDTIDQYGEQVCGIELGSADESSSNDFDPSAGTITEQLITQLMQLGLTQEQATCFADNADFTDPNFGTDLNAIAELFEQCEIDPTQLVGLGE